MKALFVAGACAALFIPYVAVAADSSSTDTKGTLCFRQGANIDFASESCTSQSFTKEVAPATEARDFVWRLPGSLVLGSLPKGERRLDARPSLNASLTISSSDFNYWPVDVHFDVTSSDHTHVWQFSIDARDINQLRKLRLPQGAYQLVVAAPHHRSVVRKIVVDSRQGDFRIGQLTMTRLPIISGTVIDASTGTGLANVDITLPSQKLLSVSDGTGRFRGEVLDDWPAYVRATYPGRGTKVTPLSKAEADTSLANIVLRRGGSLNVALSPATSAIVELARLEGEGRHVITTRDVGDSGEVTIEDLDPGEYAVLVKGSEPLQQHGSFVRIEAGVQNRASIILRPRHLHVNVRGHSQAVTGATLEFLNTGSGWRGIVADCAGNGNFDMGLWQTGEFTVFATLPQHGGYVTHATLEGNDDINWQLDLPSHSVKGRIADGRTGEVVPDANVFLQVSTPAGASTVWTTSSRAGEFEFPFVPGGHAVLSALAAGFLETRDAFDLPESDANLVRPLRLDRAHIVKLTVANQAGVPIVGAVVVDSGGDERAPLRTDETGTVAVPLRADENKLVYIIPREGSFGTATLASGEDHAAAVIGPALSTIRIVATAEPDGTPVPDAGFIIRFNGTIVPPPVVGVLAAEQGLQLRTGSDGMLVWSRMPSGVYELFPIFNAAEASRVLRGFDAPKAQLSAKLGDNLVSLTFRQK
jgi:hypothetical protein